ncbi:MAG: sensor histidine kinase [Acidimicrobiales bacterium]
MRGARSEVPEQALRESERRCADAVAEADRLRPAFDSLAEAVIVFDESGRVVLKNRQSLELEASHQVAALVEAAVEELLYETADGSSATKALELHGPPPRSLVITTAPLRHGERLVGTIAMVDDVSERRRLEAMRRDFVANVSHELRTPIGALGVLAEALGGETDPEVTARVAGRIVAEAERAGRLIEDLLDLSRIEVASTTTRRRVDIGRVLHAAADRVRPLANRRGVEVSVSPAPKVVVSGDEGQLVSAVANLLDNAVKYSDRGSAVQVVLTAGRQVAEVQVRDAGIGIPAKDLERVVERFYRVDRARSRETGGTGLGLSIVRHVATNHGGDVLVESREGEGSTFTLRLPRSAR